MQYDKPAAREVFSTENVFLSNFSDRMITHSQEYQKSKLHKNGIFQRSKGDSDFKTFICLSLV